MRKYLMLNVLFCLALFTSCSELTDPVPSQDKYGREIFTDITRAQEFLNPAYDDIRKEPWLALEYYTDNAIHKINDTRAITVENCPVQDVWAKSYKNQLHINEFLDRGFDVPYDIYNEETSNALISRIRGEAFGLRAYYKWLLLKNYAGPSSIDSEMLGFPIIDGMYTVEGMDTIPRATYMECYHNIMNDLDSASALIDVKKYEGDGLVDGVKMTSRINCTVVAVMRSRLALYAASPAYKQISWEAAVDTIYNALQYSGGLIGLQVYGDFNTKNNDNDDNLWRVSYFATGEWESNNFPPSLFGKGQCNPTQNFVNIFSDRYGYPITHADAEYDLEELYENRDRRLERFVFHNGDNDFKFCNIETFEGGVDLSGAYQKVGTRTGYYMKKFLSSEIELDKTKSLYNTAVERVYPVFTRTLLYLDYAEAMANAYGTSTPAQYEYSAVKVIKKIRQRPLTSILLDDYIEESFSKDELIALVNNERRIETAFEGERYYDLRRLLTDIDYLNQDKLGVLITKDANGELEYVDNNVVSSQQFKEYMYYNPIPRVEVLKSKNIIQNKDWE